MKHKHLLLSLASISLVALLSLGTLGFVKAQQNGAPKSMSSLPRLYLSNIKLNETSYKVGDTVKGTFDIQNGDVDATPDIKYLVSLVGLSPDGHVARVEYDTKEEGPVSIEGKTTKTISFSYDIKTAPSNDNLAIHIRAILKDGNSLAWYLTPIKISGGLSMMNVVDGFVTLNGNKYGLQEGPTVKASERIAFTGAYFNKSSANVSLTPTTVMLDKSNQPITNIVPITGQSVEFLRNATSTVTFDLPVTSLKQGVYLAKTSLLDAKGNKRVPDLFARYIVAGDIVNVRSVYSDANFPLKKDQKLTLAVGYTGNPVDITKITSASSTPTSTPVIANIEVILKNQDNETVTDTTLKDQSFSIVGFSQVPVTLSNNASSLTAEVVVSQNENVLARYTGNVVYDASRKFLNPGESKNPYLLYYYIAAVLLAIILLVIVFFWRRKYLMAVVVLVVVVGGGVVRGFVVTSFSSSWEWTFGNTTTLPFNITGGPPIAVPAASPFGMSINGTVQMEACSNSSLYIVSIYSDFYGQTGYSPVGINNPASMGTIWVDPSGYGHYTFWTPYYDFYLFYFTIPSPVGTYNVNMTIDQYYGGSILIATMSGYWPVAVTQPLSIYSCSSSPANSARVGTNVTWTASSTGGLPPYTYTWNDGTTDTNHSSSTVRNYTIVGTKSMGLMVTDSGGQTVSRTCPLFNVISGISASCSPSPSNANTGNNVTWTATSTGGTPPYSYTWSDTTTYTNHTSSMVINYTTGGLKFMNLSVTDNAGLVLGYVACSPASITAVPPISTANCYPSPNSANTGDYVTWVPTISGGTQPYTLTWTDENGTLSLHSAVSRTYTSPGYKSMKLVVTDAKGQTFTEDPCTSTVNINNVSTLIPSITTFNAIPNIINKNGSCNMFGTLDKTTINASTTCSISGGGFGSSSVLPINVSTGAVNNSSAISDAHVFIDTNYTLTCTQPDNPTNPIAKKTTGCKINPSMTEGN